MLRFTLIYHKYFYIPFSILHHLSLSLNSLLLLMQYMNIIVEIYLEIERNNFLLLQLINRNFSHPIIFPNLTFLLEKYYFLN